MHDDTSGSVAVHNELHRIAGMYLAPRSHFNAYQYRKGQSMGTRDFHEGSVRFVANLRLVNELGTHLSVLRQSNFADAQTHQSDICFLAVESGESSCGFEQTGIGHPFEFPLTELICVSNEINPR